jgi:hypothetical protein
MGRFHSKPLLLLVVALSVLCSASIAQGPAQQGPPDSIAGN